jgi:hypothetical protein
MIRSWTLVLVTVGAMVLAGCGDGGSSNTAAGGTPAPSRSPRTARSTATAPDACSLISAADLAGILGGDDFPERVGGGESCAFLGRGSAAHINVQVGVQVMRRDEYESARLGEETAEEIPGLGETAYLVKESDAYLRLRIYTAGLRIMVTLIDDGDASEVGRTPVEARVEHARRIAAVALSRLEPKGR